MAEKTETLKKQNFFFKLRQRWHSLPLRWRILSYLLVFTILMILLLWLFQIVYLDEFYRMIKTNQIEVTADVLAHEIEEDDLAEVAETLGQQREICISIFAVQDSGWTVSLAEICRVDILGDCVIHHQTIQALRLLYDNAVRNGGVYQQIIDRDAFVQPLTDETGFWNRITMPDSLGTADSMVYGEVIDTETGSYFLMLNSSLAPVDATVFTLRSQLICISAIFFMAALLLSIIIAERLSIPVTNLTKSAHRLAAGDFSGGFDGRGYREINDLADTLNFAAAELGKSGRLQQEILANITHDLRTPMTMIGGYAEYMRDFPDEDHRESLNVIIDETKRMNRLINDVLDLSKMRAGVLPMNITVFDLTAELEDFVERYNHLMSPDGYHFSLTWDERVEVQGDQEMIFRAVGNMVNNALTHCGEDKQILIGQQVEGDKVKVTITDHGVGMSEEILSRIWERYYHADAPQRAGKGSGLGLSIVKGIMEMHEAEYGAESTPGKGSTFWFKLKRYQDEAYLAAAEEKKKGKDNKKKEKKKS